MLCAAVYIPGQTSLPPVDRDESRFAQASRQMFESVALPAAERDAKMHSGGLVVPMLVDVPRLNKPPLVYWLQSASAALFTWGRPLEDAIWMYRVPSALSALVAVFATWRLGLKMLDPRAALLGAMLLAVAPMVVWDAHQARADQLLLACTTVCMGGLWGVWRGRSGRVAEWQSGKAGLGSDAPPIEPDAPGGAVAAATAHASTNAQSPVPSAFFSAFLFWLALAAGIMAKGPATPLVAGLAIVWLSFTTRSWRWALGLRPLMGAAIVAVCVGPWVWAVAQRQGGLGPYAQLVWDEFFARGLRGSKEGHFAPPGTHTVLLAALFWPGSLLTLAGFVATWKRARGHAAQPAHMQPHHMQPAPSPGLRPGLFGRASAAVTSAFRNPWRGRDAEMFLIAWIVPMWVVFELSLAKLPHYTMPMYPAIALVSASLICRWADARVFAQETGIFLWGVIGALATGAVMRIAVLNLPEQFRIPLDLRDVQRNALVVIFSLGIAWFLGLLCAVRAGNTGHWLRAQTIAVLLAIPLAAVAVGLCAPRLVPGADTARVFSILGSAAHGRQIGLASNYREASMVFAARGRVVPLDAVDTPQGSGAQLPRVIVLDDTQVPRAVTAGWRVSPCGRMGGRDLYAGTRP